MKAKNVLDLYRKGRTRLTRQSRWNPVFNPQNWQLLFGHASEVAESRIAPPIHNTQGTTARSPHTAFVSHNRTANSIGLQYLPVPIPKNNWTSVLEEVKKLKELKTNWDGYGGKPISREVAAAATELVNVLSKHTAIRPMVVPMSTGHLQFEWHSGSRVLELELEDRKTIHYLKWFPTQHTEEESIVSIESESAIRNLLDWFEVETQQSNG